MGNVGRPDLSGVWRQVKNENLDGFLKELGFPWVVRKCAIKYGSQSTDIVRQKGSSLSVTTVNAKCSWTRTLQEGRETVVHNADGVPCKASASWDGQIHKSRLEPLTVPAWADMRRVLATETWRYIDGGLMVVRSSLRPEKGRETVMFWFLERLDDEPAPQRSCFGVTSRHAALARDQKRVQNATEKDNAFTRYLAHNVGHWTTPADQYMKLRASERAARDSAVLSRSTSPRSHTSALASPFAGSPMPPGGAMPISRDAGGAPAAHAAPAAGGAAPAAAGAPEWGPAAVAGQQCPTPSLPPRHGYTLSRGSSGGSALPPGLPLAGGPAAESGAGSGGSGMLHAHAAAARRSSNALSDLGAGVQSPGSTSRARRPAGESLEAQLSHKLAEYAENRSITSVVPVCDPLTTDEPELLEMSPEQAEATQLKLSELERELRHSTQHRQHYAAGHDAMTVLDMAARERNVLYTTTGDPVPSTSETLTHVALAGTAFMAVDALLTHGPPYPWLARRIDGAAAPSVGRAERARILPNAIARLVSLLHISFTIPLSVALLWRGDLAGDRLYAQSWLSWRMLTVSAGYFVYDVYVHLLRFEYAAGLAHALGACVVFCVGTSLGILHCYGALFMLWELSTPFVFMRWLLHSLGRQNSKLYLANGVAMIVVFFLCRNLLGVAMSLDFWRVSGAELADPRPNGVASAFFWAYRGLNLMFNFLNTLWMYKMLRGIVKLLTAKRPAVGAEADVTFVNGKAKGHEE
ncbi:hypothetical protein WJX81_001623 [Elliptochloris bilobata]|uniref:TLC domain-containing protein n=1 Tax=Elliptochloris bilobata TaxID=381761 RepID=A0AAW1RY15_9CHLO